MAEKEKLPPELQEAYDAAHGEDDLPPQLEAAYDTTHGDAAANPSGDPRYGHGYDMAEPVGPAMDFDDSTYRKPTALETGITEFGRGLSLNLSDRAGAAIQDLAGVRDYDDALGMIQDDNARVANANPTAAIVGNAAGSLTTAAALPTLAAAKRAKALELIAKGVGIGATQSAASAPAHQTAGQTATDAALGGIVGGGLGTLGAVAGKAGQLIEKSTGLPWYLSNTVVPGTVAAAGEFLLPEGAKPYTRGAATALATGMLARTPTQGKVYRGAKTVMGKIGRGVSGEPPVAPAAQAQAKLTPMQRMEAAHNAKIAGPGLEPAPKPPTNLERTQQILKGAYYRSRKNSVPTQVAQAGARSLIDSANKVQQAYQQGQQEGASEHNTQMETNPEYGKAYLEQQEND